VAYVDANRLLTAGYDRTLGVWDTATGQRQLQLRGHTDAIWSATVSGRIVASTSFDGTIQIQSLDRAGEWESRRPVEGPVTRLTLSSTGQLLVGSRNGDLAALPAPSNPLARTVEPPASRKATPGSSAVLALKDSGQAAFALPTDGTMVSWSTKNGETRGVRKSPFPMATAAAFAPGSEFRLALASTERKLMLYLTPDAEPIWTAPLPQRVGAIAFSPDGKRLALAPAEGETGPLMLLDSATGREIAQLAKELTGTRTLAFSPDGQRLAAGLVDTTARIWDLTRGGGKELHQLRGHGAKVEAIAWTADGRRLATGSPDGTIKLWDTSMGDELLALPAPDGDTTALLLHPDGTTLFAGGARGEVRCFRTTK
jgi:WD40 repeat protein